METPKEKAENLVDKFIAQGCLFANAKQCAEIAVDEIIKAFDLYGNDLMGEINYWQEVLNELNKL